MMALIHPPSVPLLVLWVICLSPVVLCQLIVAGLRRVLK